MNLPKKYVPTETQRQLCFDIIKELVNTEDFTLCEQYAQEIFKTVYAIGGDYGENTLRAVAKGIITEKNRQEVISWGYSNKS